MVLLFFIVAPFCQTIQEFSSCTKMRKTISRSDPTRKKILPKSFFEGAMMERITFSTTVHPC
jgi:hypothetical protein